MRWFYFSWILAIAFASSTWAWIHHETQELDRFCATLPNGWEIGQVRDAARQNGYQVALEAHVQMKIVPSHWLPAPPQCRVFFNEERVVEYRVFQKPMQI